MAEFVDEHAAKAGRTYAAAADHYPSPALGLWDRFGAATVARVPLVAGNAVPDLCAGAGASAIPAARAVDLTGRVLGVDLAAPFLDAARARAAEAGPANVELRRGDARRTDLPDRCFDAVLCVFGVFFAPNMDALTAEMWRLVRPGGTLAITTWGPELFEPANTVFWEAVGDLAPALVKAFDPWDEITTPAALTGLLGRSGVCGAEVEATGGGHRLREPADFWQIVLGSGYRATVQALAPDHRDALRSTVLARLRERHISTLRTDVVYSRARRRG